MMYCFLNLQLCHYQAFHNFMLRFELAHWSASLGIKLLFKILHTISEKFEQGLGWP